jgi:hypothetical protein
MRAMRIAVSAGMLIVMMFLASCYAYVGPGYPRYAYYDPYYRYYYYSDYPYRYRYYSDQGS